MTAADAAVCQCGFWDRVDKSGECWLWTGPLDRGGYGAASVDGTKHKAHRFAYEVEVGPIPEGLHIDHLCRVRACVNPAHLEPVTLAENNRRAAQAIYGETCKRGHPWTPENIYIDNGWRSCRRCHADRSNRTYRAKKLGVVKPCACGHRPWVHHEGPCDGRACACEFYQPEGSDL